MDNGLEEFAIRLEAMLPRLMRSLFNPDPEDPLIELPMAQLRVMRTLFVGDRTVSDLSEDFALSMSACTQMINRLESMGLVARRGDTDDRRVRHIGLSEEGRHKMLERRRRRVDRAKKVLAGMEESEQNQVVSVLEKLLATAEPHAHGAESLSTTAELEQALPIMPPYAPKEPGG